MKTHADHDSQPLTTFKSTSNAFQSDRSKSRNLCSEAIAQPKLFSKIQNSPQMARQQKAIDAIQNSPKIVLQQKQTRTMHHQGVVAALQRRPNDINRDWELSIVNNQITNQAAARNDRSVAWPLNKLNGNGLDSAYLGGHLFKAEYGGHDDITNVVPWVNAAEKKYTTFEKAYLRSTEAAKDNQGDAETQVSVSAKFKKIKNVRANQIKAYRPKGSTIQKPQIGKIVASALSLIPSKVSSKDDKGNSVDLGSSDLGHGAPNLDGLKNLVGQPDPYIQAIEDDVDRVEKLG
ncbi:MAG: hypothetical protein GKS05_12460 [Nitrospirales bacterium]|nr:hypothetical protein [Nitrospirales bacterium]